MRCLGKGGGSCSGLQVLESKDTWNIAGGRIQSLDLHREFTYRGGTEPRTKKQEGDQRYHNMGSRSKGRISQDKFPEGEI